SAHCGSANAFLSPHKPRSFLHPPLAGGSKFAMANFGWGAARSQRPEKLSDFSDKAMRIERAVSMEASRAAHTTLSDKQNPSPLRKPGGVALRLRTQGPIDQVLPLLS